MTATTRALVQPERLEPVESLVSSLQASGIQEKRLMTGATAPSFLLKSANGKSVALADLLAIGPVVLKFFRGRWDAYDMTELEAWQTLQPALRERQALLVAISPQLQRQNAFTADRHALSFPMLSDPGNAVAQSFGLVYTVAASTQAYYRSILVNLPFLNGDESWRLPLPATFVLNPNGKIVWSEAFADFRRRPEPADALLALDALPRP